MLKIILLILSFQAISIINGQRVSLNSKFESFNASWNLEGSHFCSGVVISQQYILTAAHCASDQLHSVRFGNKSQQFRISRVFIHPFYRKHLLSARRPSQQVNDLAVLELARVIPQAVEPITIYSELSLPGRALLFGYGKESNSGQMGTLRYKRLNIIDYFVESGEWVTSFAACGGDSGGPLVFEDEEGELKLIGITSRSDPRDNIRHCIGPAIQTDLIHQRWWLSQFI